MWHTGKGTKLALRMGGNGLGFLRMIPITDHRRIQRLLDENPVVRKMVESSSEYQHKLLAPVGLSPMPLVLPPVPMDEYLAALFRKDTHTPHSGDEVVLSHAVSRGVEQLTYQERRCCESRNECL